jgi:hypothetical protein
VETFVANVVIKVLLDDRVQAKIKELLGGVITESILPLVPVAVASAVNAAIQQIPGVENVKDVAGIANTVRDDLNKIIPDIDVGIPALDDLLDFWRPKG